MCQIVDDAHVVVLVIETDGVESGRCEARLGGVQTKTEGIPDISRGYDSVDR